MISLFSTTNVPAQRPSRGVTLLVAVILSSVILSVAIALLDVAYKQQLLASTAKQSQFAFYNADSVMECALYFDQKQNAFDFTAPAAAGTIACNNVAILNYAVPVVTANSGGFIKTFKFDVSCTGSDLRGTITLIKSDGVGVCSGVNHTCIYATGYSSCSATDPRRIERGLKVLY